MTFVVEVPRRNDVLDTILKVTEMPWIKLREIKVEPSEV
jgi:hypothetical protein